MNHEVRAVVACDEGDLEQIAVAGRPEAQGGVVVLSVAGHGVGDGVFDIPVVDAVPSRRRVDLHKPNRTTQ